MKCGIHTNNPLEIHVFDRNLAFRIFHVQTRIMKNLFLLSSAGILLMLCLSGCVKTQTTKTYTITRPVYRVKSDVYQDVKTQPATSITTAGKLFMKGNYIFLSEKNKGIHIINNANPSAPVNESFIPIPGTEDVVVKGNILLADCFIDLLSIDISDPANAKLVNIEPNVFPERRFVNGFTLDSNLVIVDWVSKDTTTPIDFYDQFGGGVFWADNFSPATTGGTGQTGISGSMARFTISGNYLYTVSNSNLRVFDIGNAVKPVVKSNTNMGWNIETIYPLKDKLFIGSQSGMFVYSIVNPIAPVQLCTFTHATSCDPVIADDQYAYITLRSGTACQGFTNQLDIVDISDITKPTWKKTYGLTNPHGLSKDANLLFICDGADGLKVFDATDISNLQLLQTIHMSSTFDVITWSNRAIVSAADGIYQYDYSDPLQIKLLSKIAKN